MTWSESARGHGLRRRRAAAAGPAAAGAADDLRRAPGRDDVHGGADHGRRSSSATAGSGNLIFGGLQTDFKAQVLTASRARAWCSPSSPTWRCSACNAWSPRGREGRGVNGVARDWFRRPGQLARTRRASRRCSCRAPGPVRGRAADRLRAGPSAGALARAHRPGRRARDQRRPTSAGPCPPSRCSRCWPLGPARASATTSHGRRAGAVRHPADPHQRLRRDARGRPRHRRGRPRDGDERRGRCCAGSSCPWRRR